MDSTLEALRQRLREPGLVPGFTIQNVLGAGGQGMVVRAQKDATGRLYAIKFFARHDPTRPATWQCEWDEVAALAPLRHPNLVSIEDRGTVDAVPYLVLEYAGDDTLRERIRTGTVRLQEGLGWVGAVGDAVRYMHDRGLLHLDVKPSNVFVHDGRVRLGDFGLVRRTSMTGPVELTLALGTPDYIAPEIVAHQRATPAADVFGLGRLLEDVLVAASVLENRPAPSWLGNLASEAAAADPGRRPPLPHFLERLRAPEGRRTIRFRPVSRPGPAPGPLFRRARG